MKNVTHIPPSHDPKQCICGGATFPAGQRTDIVCPCCDDRYVVPMPPEARIDLLKLASWGVQ